MTSTAPVFGSIATAAPSVLPIAARATACKEVSSVKVTESAALVGARSCSKLCGGSEWAARKLLYCCSIPSTP
jgi:hypothetical protein